MGIILSMKLQAALRRGDSQGQYCPGEPFGLRYKRYMSMKKYSQAPKALRSQARLVKEAAGGLKGHLSRAQLVVLALSSLADIGF